MKAVSDAAANCRLRQNSRINYRKYIYANGIPSLHDSDGGEEVEHVDTNKQTVDGHKKPGLEPDGMTSYFVLESNLRNVLT